jgi:hypothetical protein
MSSALLLTGLFLQSALVPLAGSAQGYLQQSDKAGHDFSAEPHFTLVLRTKAKVPTNVDKNQTMQILSE